MKHTVIISKRAKKYIAKQDSFEQQKIYKRLSILEDSFVPSDAKYIGKENGQKIFRLRSQDLRIFYYIIVRRNMIVITEIEKRSKAYPK